MDDPIVTFGVVVLLLAAAASLAIVGTRMRDGRLPPNNWVGVRTELAFRSRENWYRVQALAGPRVIFLSFVYLDCAILFVIQGIFYEIIPFIAPVLLTIMQTLVAIVLIYRRANTCKKLPNSLEGECNDHLN